MSSIGRRIKVDHTFPSEDKSRSVMGMASSDKSVANIAHPSSFSCDKHAVALSCCDKSSHLDNKKRVH